MDGMLVTWVKISLLKDCRLSRVIQIALDPRMVFEAYRFSLLQASNVHSFLSVFTTTAHVKVSQHPSVSASMLTSNSFTARWPGLCF